MTRLKGKVAIVTGANSGIGKATAELFAQEGAKVVLAARRPDKLKEVEDAIRAAGGEALSVPTDVTVPDDCEALVKCTVETYGKIDILVNNAGIADKHRPITRCDYDWWNHVIAINQTSLFLMCKAVLPYMEAAKSGSIINISSIGGTRGNSGMAYTAAKSAVLGMTRNMAIQYAGTGIRVNSVAPGPTPTPLNTPEQIATFDSEFADQCNGYLRLELPQPAAIDQAYAILFFAGDESKMITGQIMTVDNGIAL